MSSLPRDIRLLASIARAVWRGIDWETPMWRDRLSCYDRFTSRIVAASSAASLREFAARLAAKCGVSAPAYDGEVLDAIMCGESVPHYELMRVARKEAGLIVSVVRLLQERAKEGREQR